MAKKSKKMEGEGEDNAINAYCAGTYLRAKDDYGVMAKNHCGYNIVMSAKHMRRLRAIRNVASVGFREE